MSGGASAQSRPTVVRDAKGKRPRFFDPPAMDHLMSMIMVLASDLSSLRDRLDSVERVTKAYGIDLATEIEALELDQTALEEREARRQDLLSRLFYLARKEASEATRQESDDSFRATIDDIARR